VADLGGMVDGTDTAALATGSYEGRTSVTRVGGRPRIQVEVRPVRRRNWSVEDKLRIVRETLEPGAVAKAVADRHGISTGLLYTWRKEMLATAISGFAPVAVVPEAPRVEATPPQMAASETRAEPPGTIEIAFPSGATVRVSGRVDPAALRGVLVELGGR
jgi:transposase